MTRPEFIEAFLNCDEETKNKIECILNNPQDKQSLEYLRTLDCVDYYKVCKALNVPLDYYLKEA